MNGVFITLVHIQAKLGLGNLLRIVDESDMIQSSSLGGLSFTELSVSVTVIH